MNQRTIVILLAVLVVLGLIERGETLHGEQMGSVVSRLLKERIIFVGGDGGAVTTDSANLLICPNLDAANILYNVLKTTTSGGVTVGPILMGAAATAYILTTAATVRRVLNMTALAAASHKA